MNAEEVADLHRILAYAQQIMPQTVEDVLAWHSRWSGRPSREQIQKVLRDDGICQNCCHKEIADAILALYPSAAPEKPRQVSREEIEKAIWGSPIQNRICIKFDSLESSDRWVDRIYNLLSGKKEPKWWCEHWIWNENRHVWYREGWQPISTAPLASMDYDICPVAGCHAKRPDDA